jgi:hypothetical protein
MIESYQTARDARQGPPNDEISRRVYEVGWIDLLANS